MATMKFKNAKGVQQGCQSAGAIFVWRAKHANREATRYLKMHRAGGLDWVHEQWLRARAERDQWMWAVRVLRDQTHNGVPEHVVGKRRLIRDSAAAQAERQKAA